MPRPQATTIKPLIIVTDDDSGMLELYEEILEHLFDANVLTTTNPEEALQFTLRKVPELFITDLVKPQTSGVDLITQLRSHRRVDAVPIWVVSGQARTSLGDRAKEAGADLVMTKPVTVEELVQHGDLLFRRERAGQFDHLLDVRTEAPDLDYKEELAVTRDGIASLAKDVIAMGNFGGGSIVFGVAEAASGDFDLVGLPPAQLERLEVTKLNSALREYIDPPHGVKCHRVKRSRRQFMVVRVPPVTETLLLAKKQNDAARLFPGRIYTRTSAAESGEVRDNTELRNILNRLSARTARNDQAAGRPRAS